MGAAIVRVQAELDMAAGTFSFRPDDLDGALRKQAQTKARRVLALLAAERGRRDGKPRRRRPRTAADLWAERKQQQER